MIFSWVLPVGEHNPTIGMPAKVARGIEWESGWEFCRNSSFVTCGCFHTASCCIGLRCRKNEININRSLFTSSTPDTFRPSAHTHTLEQILLKVAAAFVVVLIMMSVLTHYPTWPFLVLVQVWFTLTHTPCALLYAIGHSPSHQTTCPVKHCIQCFVAVFSVCGHGHVIVCVFECVCSSVCVCICCWVNDWVDFVVLRIYNVSPEKRFIINCCHCLWLLPGSSGPLAASMCAKVFVATVQSPNTEEHLAKKCQCVSQFPFLVYICCVVIQYL